MTDSQVIDADFDVVTQPAPQPVEGTSHAVLTQASHQWATRPDDQRFLSLTDLQAFKHGVRDRAQGSVVSTRKLKAFHVDGDPHALGVEITNDNGRVVDALPTNWAFGQLAQRAGAPGGYLGSLRSDLASDCINYGLLKRDVDSVGVLTLANENGGPAELAAATGPNYGRIWDADIVDQLVRSFGDGRTGDFRIPGEFGVQVPITKQNTTLYASDRDLFVFLADEEHRIEIPNRRNGQPGSLARGFFIKNSEVGSTTLSIAGFYFDYACRNRCVWGVEGFKEVSIRHTSGAPDRFLEEVRPALLAYSNASDLTITRAIEDARNKRIDDVDDFLISRFTRSQAKQIQKVHEIEEQRPIETLWDAATGITAYAKGIEHQAERVEFERSAGKVLSLAS